MKSLLTQTVQDFELIVVLDGSTDDTLKVVKSFEQNFSNLKIVIQENKGRAAVRNRGVKESTGSLLIFYDDDMEPASDSILKHKNFHEQNIGILTCNPTEKEDKLKPDIQNYKAFISNEWTKKYQDGLNELTQSNLFFTGANCSMRREQFFSLSGFDESLRDAEDFDFALRALKASIKVFFDKTNIAIHHDPITCIGYIKRLREYRQAQQMVAALHPYINIFVDVKIGFGKKILYSIFSLNVLPKIIDNFNIFLVLPKMLRYRFYSLVIHSLSKIYFHVRL